MTYAYDKGKGTRKLHILNKYGYTYCKVENGRCRKESLIKTDSVPKDRQICSMCKNLESRNKNSDYNGSKKKGLPKSVKKPNDFYKSDEWARFRFNILKDADRCLCCGASKQDARLTVDHIIPLWKRPDLCLDRNNTQVLCLLCNRGKGGYDESDLRPKENEQDIDESLDKEYLLNVVKLFE